MPVIDLGSVVGPQGPQGVAGQTGATGATGAAGPNQVTGSTSTTLNGILQGNGTAVSALQSDSAPTKGSNNAMRSGAIYNALNQKPNPNLLRNWCFAGGGSGKGIFPVNQTGVTSWSTAGWACDGWLRRGDYPASLTINGFSATVIADENYKGLNQSMSEVTSQLLGKTVTLSVLVQNNTLSEHATYPRLGIYAADTISFNSDQLISTKIDGNGLFSVTGTMPSSIARAGLVFSPLYIASTATTMSGSITIVAAKLELGSQQTLAHQESGVWVLNEIPDWSEELLKCQTNFGTTLDAGSRVDPMANLTAAIAEMIAPVEYGTKASQAYSTGKIFCWKGLLYKAKTSISSGATLTDGTNCEQTTLAALMSL